MFKQVLYFLCRLSKILTNYKSYSDPASAHLRKRLSSSSCWYLCFTLRLQSCSSDLLMSCIFSKRLIRSCISLDRIHSYSVIFFLTQSFWSISFFCLYLLHFIASQHLLFLLQLCLMVVQFFRSLGGSTKIYLEDLSVWNTSHLAVLIQQWTE